MKQVDYTPNLKIQAAGVSGAASIVIIWVLAQLGVEMPPEVAAAVTTILSVGAGYLKSE